MRQIKFRCWDKIEKKYRFDSFLKTGDGRGDWILFLFDQLQPETPDKLSFSANKVYPRDGFVLEEFTNIEDKNGKEIYEGDIIKYNRIISPDCSEEVIGLIEYINCGFWITKAYFYNIQITSDCEIIGNKFENSDLLKSND